MRVLVADHRPRHAALDKAGLHTYAVIALRRDLPAVGGGEVCRRLAERRSGARLLVLADIRDPADVVDVLALGADDYHAPCDLGELTARLAALARRSEWRQPPVLRRGQLAVDPARRQARLGARALRLGPKEFGVLRVVVMTLRRRLGDPAAIETVPGVGYCLR